MMGALMNLPHNLEAEQALLGKLMFDNDVLEQLPPLAPGAFYDPVHGRIFNAIKSLIAQKRLADGVTLDEFFATDGGIKEIGGRKYLMKLMEQAAPLTGQAVSYAHLIRDLAARRQLIAIGVRLSGSAQSPPEGQDAMDLAIAAERELQAIGAGAGARDVSLREAGASVVESLSRPWRGLATGIAELDNLIGGLTAPDLVILAGRPGMGKAQPLDAKVMRSDGSWALMGELRLGDELASTDGARSLVSGIYPQGRRQVFRVTFSDGRSTECCAEHLWSVRYRDWDGPRILTTTQILQKLSFKRYLRRLSVEHIGGEFGVSIPVPVDPWLLGLYLGDGCGARGRSVHISTADESTLERVRSVVAGTNVRLVHRAAYDWRLCTERMGGQPNHVLSGLRALGVVSCLAHEKFVPEVYKMLPRAGRLALLQGLMDADGWVEKFGCTRFSSASERLADDVVYLARSLGLWASKSTRTNIKYTYKGETRRGRNAHVVTIAGRETLFRLPRKNHVHPIRRYAKPPVIMSIEPTRMAATQCISVTHPSRLYVTDDFVVTHNTSLAVNLAYNVARGHVVSEDGQPIRPRVVAFFSMEMSAEQLAGRALSRSSTGEGRMAFGYSNLYSREFRPRADAVSPLLKWMPETLRIDDAAAQSVANMRASCRDIRARFGGLDLVVVDYLQLACDPNTRKTNRVEEVTAISGGLKAIAKDMRVPVLALSQLSRQVESRADKLPQNSDLRESGSIEQDADIILFVYREHYYLNQNEPHEREGETRQEFEARKLAWMRRKAETQNVMTAICGKRRNGPVGTAELYCDLAHDVVSDPQRNETEPRRKPHWLED